MRLFLIALFLSPASFVFAHSAPSGFRYEPYCCTGNSLTGDCQVIPKSSVKMTVSGYAIDVGPGDHRLVTKPHNFLWSERDTRRSTDGEYHLCLYPTEDTPRCFYAPDMSF